jgi:hypothetical protein
VPACFSVPSVGVRNDGAAGAQRLGAVDDDELAGVTPRASAVSSPSFSPSVTGAPRRWSG